MTDPIDRTVSQFEFVWGQHKFRQVGEAFRIVEKQFGFRGNIYVDPWVRIGILRSFTIEHLYEHIWHCLESDA